MATLTVGPNSTFPSIAAAMGAAVPGDIISLEPGYSNETATVTVDNIFVDGTASSTNILLNLAGGVATFTLQGNAPIDVVDSTGNNTITGNAGDNDFTMTGGSDVLDGGAGSDRLIADFSGDTAGLTVTLTPGTTDGSQGVVGSALINHEVSFDNIDSFNLKTGNGDDVISLAAGDDIVSVIGGTDVVNGGAGNDLLIVDYSDETQNVTSQALLGDPLGGFQGGFSDQTPILGDSVSFSSIERFDVTTGSGNDSITTGDGNDVIRTNAGADTIVAGGGNDLIEGGAGADNIDGGLGNDTASYANSTSGVTVTVNGSGSGGDAAGDLLSGIENLIGSGLADTLIGDGANNVLSGGGGIDTLIGMAGDNTLDGGAGTGDIADYSAAPSRVLFNLGVGSGSNGYGGTDTLTGIETIVGSAFSDVLIGSSGSPSTLIGGGGNDSYGVDNAGDVIVEAAGGGTEDWVVASVSYTLPSNVEVLTLTTPGTTGTGNAGNNVLFSSSGVDTLAGLDGNDVYFVNNTNDVITETPGGGFDIVYANVSYTLSANLEALGLTSAGTTGTGNELSNVLLSSSGIDTLVGMDGDDFYLVNNSGDQIIEGAGFGSGFDWVVSSVSYTLPTNVEILMLTNPGTTGTGNAGDNVFFSSNGVDSLVGMDGNDVYFVNNVNDVVTEAAGGGNDIVYASVDYTLSDNIEILALRTAGTTGTGNGLNNTFYSSSGVDTMVGLDGDDVYVVNNTNDVINEASGAGSGTDWVFASASYTLGANVENMILQTGAGAINGTGNAVANEITGNESANVLDGRGGADYLVGGAGADTFVFRQGEANGDIVSDFSGGGFGQGDTLQFVGFGAGATFENLSAANGKSSTTAAFPTKSSLW